MEYKIHRNEHDEIKPCQSCKCEVATYPFDWGPPYNEQHDDEKRHLCEFCASSYVGNITRHHHKRDDASYIRQEIAILIAQAVNHVISKIQPSSNP